MCRNGEALRSVHALKERPLAMARCRGPCILARSGYMNFSGSQHGPVQFKSSGVVESTCGGPRHTCAPGMYAANRTASDSQPRWIALHTPAVEGNPGLCSVLLELIKRTGAERVCAHQSRLPPLLHVVVRKLQCETCARARVRVSACADMPWM